MRITDLFVKRPVLAIVVNLVILIAGLQSTYAESTGIKALKIRHNNVLGYFIEVTATNAARIYGLYPRKGTIAVGSDADLVVWDQDREVVITADLLHSACDYTPYEGMRVRGWPTLVFSRGEVVVEEGKLLAAPGRGRFLRCGRPSPLPA